MKIFGIGLSRTGTTSLTSALQQVGINLIHYPHSKQQLYQSRDGACDIPVIPFYKDLDKTFPGSKFIYTIRDKESWLKSCERHVTRKTAGKNFPEWQRNIRLAVYGCIDWDEEKYSQTYDKHDQDVKQYFKDRPHDLLTIDIVGGESPETLKQFLNITKDFTFPHMNKRK